MSRAEQAVLYLTVGAGNLHWGLAVGRYWRLDSLGWIGLDAVAGTPAAGAALATALPRVGESVAGRAQHLAGIRVLVADPWLALASVAWSADMLSPGEAEAFSRRQLIEAGFDLGADDTLRLDDVPYGRVRLAAAYPATLVAGLLSLAAGLATRLESLQPLSVAGWQVFGHGQQPQLAVLDRDLALLIQGGREIEDVVLVELPDDGDLRLALHLHWQRLALRSPEREGLERLPVCDLTGQPGPATAPAAFDYLPWPGREVNLDGVPLALELARRVGIGRSDLDAVQSRPAPSPGQRVVLVLTIVLTSLLVAAALHTGWQARQAAAGLALRDPEPRLTTAASAWSRGETMRVQAANAAIHQLNVPIDALLQAMHPPRDIRVAMLSLSLEEVARQGGGQSRARIVAEALTSADMARYVSYLASRRPFHDAYLVRHEIVDALPERPYRFTVEALWQEWGMQ